MQPAILSVSHRYAAWLDAHRRSIIILSMLLVLVAGAVARTLPVHADFSYLLPEKSESVQHLRALEKRARVLGTAMVVVRGAQQAERSAAALALRTRIAALGPESVSQITYDQQVARDYAWEHRWLLPSLSDLQHINDGLAPYLKRARQAAKPMVLDLDDDDALEAGQGAKAAEQGAQANADAVANLGARLAELEAKKNDPGTFVSPDHTMQMMVVQTPFAAGDVHKTTALLRQLRSIVGAVQLEYPSVQIGLAGDIVTSFEEHSSILQGMVSATLITLVLCVAALMAFYRTLYGVLMLACSLLVGTLVTFMFTRLTIGHLNVATAFLASIVLGNGINFGIMVLARYLEAMRAGLRGVEAMAQTISDTISGTLAAAVAAAVAYFSLMITAFRGFWHFGVIAGFGMLFCWACAYTVLPTLLMALDAKNMIVARPEPGLGRLLGRLVPRRTGLVVAVAAMLAVLCSITTWHYFTHDPFEDNFKNLRSESPALLEERAWMTAVDKAFGRGISGGFVIGVKKREEARPLIEKLRAIDAGRAGPDKLFSRISSLDDYLPQDQQQKLRLLQAIRAQLTEEALHGLPPSAKAKLLALRPPEHLRPLADNDVPSAVAWPFIEADGSSGKLILAMSGWGYEIWNSHDIMRYADTLRGLGLGPDVLLGGSTFVFSDMLRLIEKDGPNATLAAVLAATVVVLAVLGLCFEAVVTLVCGALGTLMMLAVVAAAGLKVNFLDFVALPITIGIGIDYAVNICARAKVEPKGANRARRALSTAGGAVCMSSYTTMVGYGSLLTSTNLGIRSFGHAAILGEITCLLAALVVAPAMLDLWGRRH